MNGRRILPAAILALAAVAACSKKAPETAPPPVNQDSIAKAHAADSAAKAAAATAAAASAKADSMAAAAAKRAQDSLAALESQKTKVRDEFKSKIYFDYDQSTLTDSAKAKLDRKIRILNANPTLAVEIEGHTDERGSAEYNMALGQRRAASVKRYLVQHGIADSRITIISYGEERPVAPGHDEDSWKQNRRAEFVITFGDVQPGT